MRDIVSYVGKEWNSMSDEQKAQIKDSQLNGKHTEITSEQVANWQAIIASRHLLSGDPTNVMNVAQNLIQKTAQNAYFQFLKEQRGLCFKVLNGKIIIRELVR